MLASGRPLPSFCIPSSFALGSWGQVVDHDSLILHDTAIARAQVRREAGVVLQPPEAQPNDDQKVGCLLRAHTLELADGSSVIGRAAVIRSIVFQKRNRNAATDGFGAGAPVAPFPIVQKNEGVPLRHYLRDLLGRDPDLLEIIEAPVSVLPAVGIGGDVEELAMPREEVTTLQVEVEVAFALLANGH